MDYLALFKQHLIASTSEDFFFSDSSEWEGTELFDFAWLKKVGPGEDASPIYIHLHPAAGLIRHTFPPIDRCCKLPPPSFTFDGNDEARHSWFCITSFILYHKVCYHNWYLAFADWYSASNLAIRVRQVFFIDVLIVELIKIQSSAWSNP